MELMEKETAFYRSLLAGYRRGCLVFDVGANVGEKIDVFLNMGAHVVAVEPDAACQKILAEKYHRFRFTPKPVKIIAKAVSDKEAIETMWVDSEGSALNTLNPKWVGILRDHKSRFAQGQDKQEFRQHREVETTTLDQLIAAHGTPFFVKIDVEGYEQTALRGLHHPVPYLSFEVNLPEFRPEALECVRILTDLQHAGKFNYSSDCLRGLNLQEWVGPEEFSEALESMPEPSIEVFWKTV
jgi:FkbM family methyltransferase